MSPAKSRPSPPAVKAVASAPTAEREPRGARRKRETRERLLDAAFRLMAERGMDAVAINEITEAADVGFGSFYNHFESKEAIYDALTDSIFEGFADALDRLVHGVEDPAEIISICVRHTILRARREPLWGRFLMREGFSARALTRGLGVRLLRDMQKGIAKGRFSPADPMMTFVVAGAGVLGAISVELQRSGAEAAVLRQIGLDTQDLAERAAAVLLTQLGLTPKEAQRITQRPLPVVELRS